MYAATVFSATAALAATVSALPSTLNQRQVDCSNEFPWFINPQPETSCTTGGTPQVASGPAPGNVATCQPIGYSATAVAVTLDGNSCGYPYNLTFYTTPDCSDPGFSTTENGCFAAFDAIPYIQYSATRLF